MRDVMGVLYVIATWTALALVYNGAIDYKHYWLQGLLGLGLGGVALWIYRRWFVGWHWHFAAGTIAALAIIVAVFAMAELLKGVLVVIGRESGLG